MSNGGPNPKKLADFAETDAIRKLLGGVSRRGAKAPEPPTPADAQAPAMAFVGDDVGATVPAESPPPLPPAVNEGRRAEDGERNQQEIPSSVPRPPSSVFREPPPPVPQPIGALSFGELLLRINWRNRPDAVEPLPMIGVLPPAGFADTVEGVLSVFNWDDE